MQFHLLQTSEIIINFFNVGIFGNATKLPQRGELSVDGLVLWLAGGSREECIAGEGGWAGGVDLHR